MVGRRGQVVKITSKDCCRRDMWYRGSVKGGRTRLVIFDRFGQTAKVKQVGGRGRVDIVNGRWWCVDHSCFSSSLFPTTDSMETATIEEREDSRWYRPWHSIPWRCLRFVCGGWRGANCFCCCSGCRSCSYLLWFLVWVLYRIFPKELLLLLLLLLLPLILWSPDCCCGRS